MPGTRSEANIRACPWPESFLLPPGLETAEDATGEGVSPRAYTKRTEPEGQDGAQAADSPEAELCTRRGVYWGAGVRTGQGRPGVSTVYETGFGRAQSEWSLAGPCSSYGAAAKRLGPSPNGTKRVDDLSGGTSRRCNWTGQPLLRRIPPTPVTQLPHQSMRQTLRRR